MANEKKPVQGGDMITVRLDFDVWDANGERLTAGNVYDLPADMAQALMDEKKAEYAGPMGTR